MPSAGLHGVLQHPLSGVTPPISPCSQAILGSCHCLPPKQFPCFPRSLRTKAPNHNLCSRRQTNYSYNFPLPQPSLRFPRYNPMLAQYPKLWFISSDVILQHGLTQDIHFIYLFRECISCHFLWQHRQKSPL